MPLFAAVAFAMIGFGAFEVNPPGPVHNSGAPAGTVEKSVTVAPSQNGPPFDTTGMAGVAFTTTVVDALAVAHEELTATV